MVAPLLPKLPLGTSLSFRILFMERDLREVLSSQQDMLQRQTNKQTPRDPDSLTRAFTHQLEVIQKMLAVRQIPTLYIRYAECLEQPEQVAKRVNEFLDGTLDENQMQQVVDQTLYRHRST